MIKFAYILATIALCYSNPIALDAPTLDELYASCMDGGFYYCAVQPDDCLKAEPQNCNSLVAIESSEEDDLTYNIHIITPNTVGFTGVTFKQPADDGKSLGLVCNVAETTTARVMEANVKMFSSEKKVLVDKADEVVIVDPGTLNGESFVCSVNVSKSSELELDKVTISFTGMEGYQLIMEHGTVDDQAAVTIDNSIPSVATYLKDLDTDQQYKDCTDSSNCLVLKKSTTKADYTDACIGKTDCDLTVAFMRDGNKYSFTATAPLTGNGWVAVGFSNDSQPMINNQAVACIQKAGGLTLDKIAIVDGSNVQKLGNDDNITLNNVELTADGFIVFSFSVDEAVSFDQMQMNFSMFGDPIFLMGAAGPLNDDGNLQKHTLNVISPESFINVPFYGTCGKEGVKCVGNTANESNNADQCIEERNCMFGISYVKVKEENEEDKFTFETLASASNDYISIQFSNGDSKADDPVIVCNVKSDVNVSLLVTDEDGNYVAGDVADDAISSQESKSRDGHFNCGFTLKKNTNVKDGQTLKLGQNSGYNLIISTGTINDKGILSETDSIRTEKKYLNSGVSLSISVPLIFLLSYIAVKFC